MIQLDELDSDGVSCQLGDEVVAELRRTKLVEVRPEGGGTWRVLPTGRVGCVSVGGVDVMVRSKASPASLLFYLAYAKNPGFRPGNVPADAGDDLWAAFAETLIRTCDLALRDGVLQGYQTEDHALSLVRGRIRISDQITRRPGAMAPVEVRYDEYTADIAENQILRGAIRSLLNVPRLSDSARRSLGHLDGKLDGVTVGGKRFRPTWVESRQNHRYQPALRVAEVILDHKSTVSSSDGGASLASFVVDMAKVFEDFVAVAIREAFGGSGRTTDKHIVHLADHKRVRMQPDVVHLRQEKPVAVFDAKYKLESSTGRYPNADVYQMLAYCTGLRVPQAWLVYAVGQPGRPAVRVLNAEVEIHQFAIDLRLSPAEVLTRISQLAQKSVAWLSVSP